MFQIFKAGKRHSSDGTEYDITAQDVLDCADCYDPKLHEAPLVFGHPKTDDPAFGWVKGLSSANGSLTAEFSDVDEGAKELVRSKKFKHVSASFYPPAHPSNPVPGKWYLRHVGLLGAMPPSVKGLGAASFSDADGCVEFSEYGQETSAGLFRRLRDWMIGKFGQEEADNVIPSWEIDSMREDATRERMQQAAEPLASFAEASTPVAPQTESPTEPQTPPIEKEPEMTEAEKQALARAEAAEKQLADLQSAQAKAEREAAHTANADFAESLVKSGKLKPAHKALAVRVLDFVQYPNDITADFGEGENQQTLGDAIRGWMSDSPAAEIFGEVATAGKAGARNSGVTADFAEADPESLSHHQRAQALADKEGISYEEAARRTVS